MADSPRAGKLLKQGPLATLSNFSADVQDRFIFNGQQFVNLVTQSPKVVGASAIRGVTFNGNEVLLKSEYPSFKDQNGNFRFTNDSPVISEVYSGWPGEYDHVVIEFNNPVTTSSVKFWSVNYIPLDYIRVDYGFDDTHFYEVDTHVGDVSFVFDDSLRLYSDETIPRGLYAYTVQLRPTITARRWRIRAFMSSRIQSKVAADIRTKNVTVTTTSGWPADSASFGLGSANVILPKNEVQLVEEVISYGAVTDNGDNTYTVNSAVFNTTSLGTVALGADVHVYEGIKIVTKSYVRNQVNPGVIFAGDPQFLSPEVQAIYFDIVYSVSEQKTTIGRASVVQSFVLNSTPDTVDLIVDSKLPAYITNFSTGPGGGRIKTVITYAVDYVPKASFGYTSVGSTTQFDSITDTTYPAADDLPAGSTLVFSYPMNVAQVQIVDNVGPALKFWETDGSEAVVKPIEVSDIYDAVFDKGDEVFYIVSFNETGGTGPPMSDSFSTGSGSLVDTDRWTIFGDTFRRDNEEARIIFENTVSGTQVAGSLISKAYFDSSFDISLSAGVSTLSGTGNFGLAGVNKTSGNQESGIYTIGDWKTTSSRSFSAVGLSQLVNATDGRGLMRNFKFSPYTLPEGNHTHKFEFDGSGWAYTREALGPAAVSNIVGETAGTGPTFNKYGFSTKIDYNPNLASGSFISFNTSRTTLSGIVSDYLLMQVSFDGADTFTASYKDGPGSLTELLQTEAIGTEFRTNIVAATDNNTFVTCSGLEATGSFQWEIPSFSVDAIDIDGKLTEVTGVSDANGSVISALDIIKEPDVTFGDFYQQVSIATMGLTEAQGGSMFVRVRGDIYKYDKTTLPLTSFEDGGGAVTLASGSVPIRGIYNFSWDGYSGGPLGYMYYDSDRQGIFVQKMSDSTLSGVDYEAQLDISAVTQPIAWDISDLETLFIVESTSVYVFNMDETSVAFCDIASSDPILPANSQDTAQIKAYVVNLYGEPLESKTVTFALTGGEGSVSPATDCTTASGTAVTTFTAGTVTGISTITATASNDVC